ncbi:MAG TPA: C1 family peptidase [Ohtaekwangia sp.]
MPWLCSVVIMQAWGQATAPPGLTLIKSSAFTTVKNQANTGTCWSFSTVSLIESQSIKNGIGEFDISEIFIVRNIYVEKAKNYILRQGKAQFGEGGLGHDVIRAIATYGAVPESVYSGLILGAKHHDHSALENKLRTYLDSLLQSRPVPSDWVKNYEAILDDHLGKVPENFRYGEKMYTPKSFASEVLHFNPDDYIDITSFTHHPFYKPFILEVPDNFLNGSYYNIPLNEMIALTEKAISSGYSIMWDADVSNSFFRQRDGYALQWKDKGAISQPVSPDDLERNFDQSMRQSLFENLTTQDDHLMHLVGTERSKGGKLFFLVKNSWGDTGPYKGFIHVSEAYFAVNTISLVIPRAVLDKSLRTKLGLP